MKETSRPALSRDRIINSALDLLDEVGLDDLTVRRLADRLEVQSPALYWHLKDKDELLDAMAETVLLDAGMGPPQEGESWPDWLFRRAHAYRDAVLAHRDGARVVMRLTSASPSMLGEFEGELRGLIDQGFTAELALATITATTHYATGFLLHEQSTPSPVSQREAAIDAGSAIHQAIRAGATVLDRAAFDRGILLLIAGVERELGERRVTP